MPMPPWIILFDTVDESEIPSPQEENLLLEIMDEPPAVTTAVLSCIMSAASLNVLPSSFTVQPWIEITVWVMKAFSMMHPVPFCSFQFVLEGVNCICPALTDALLM